MSPGTAVTNSPASMFAYQDDLIRTKKYESLGVIKIISIGPNKDCPINENDPLMRKWGRMMQFRSTRSGGEKPQPDDVSLPLAWSLDHSILLVPGLLVRWDGRVALSDWKDPEWVAPPPSRQEILGEEYVDAAGVKRSRTVARDPAKDIAPVIAQSLAARAEGRWENPDWLVFSPVLSIGFQPEKDSKLVGTYCGIDCRYNPAEDRHPTLLVNERTGQVRFYGGVYRLVAAVGENLFL